MYKSLDTNKYTNKLQFIILKMVYSILYEINIEDNLNVTLGQSFEI